MKQRKEEENESPHALEANDSWEHWKEISQNKQGRRLLETQHFDELENKPLKLTKKHEHKIENLLSQNNDIKDGTMHGMMIDAGSSGSRMHVYEFRSRVLEGQNEINAAVSGNKLSYPGTESRWTDRLMPGLATFDDELDEDLLPAIAVYLQPLLEFAESILHMKRDSFHEFPIYLKATAGMRILEPSRRQRLIKAVRDVLGNHTYCKFHFKSLDQARVISGEEEAIYGWTGVNFILGTLLQSSEGTGSVANPKLTHGALEMGGASSQISFYEPNEDIMSNLFKLQIGQGKHWNVYAHSHLYFGINEAWNRHSAYLSWGEGGNRLHGHIYDPCLPGDSRITIQSNIHYRHGLEAWPIGNESDIYHSTLSNKNTSGDFERCAAITTVLLNKQNNNWCNFSHRNDCSFSGVYQPRLPTQSNHFGEFLAFSNYYKVVDFLNIPNRFTVQTLKNATKSLCSLNENELLSFNAGRLEKEDALQMCFKSMFVYQLLHNGYGFKLDQRITAANVVNGHKIGWALGSMLYEINSLPWTYIPNDNDKGISEEKALMKKSMMMMMICAIASLFWILFQLRRRHNYERIPNLRKNRMWLSESSMNDLEIEPTF